MSEYKRLTNKEYLNKPSCFNCEHNYSNCITCERHCVDGDCFELRSELRHLAELEDKIENGTLVELPCKVGDTVYKILGEKVYEMKAVAIPLLISPHGAYLSVTAENRRSACLTLEYTDFGKTVFLTKAEALAKLEQIRKEK